MPKERTPAIVRIMNRVTEMPGPLDTPCWVCSLSLSSHGYSQVSFDGRRPRDGGPRDRFSHRVTYEHFVGPISEGLVLDHLCRVTNCVNPAHLEPVTQAENIRRGESPGALAVRTNLCKYGHSLDDAYVETSGHRKCRICGREKSRRAYLKRRERLLLSRTTP